jgi:hypothetical protein
VSALSQTVSGVADGVGALCRLTLGPQDQLRGPADVADVVGGLHEAAVLLPRLFGQLAAFLEVEGVKGVIASAPAAGALDGGPQVRAISDALHRAGLDAEAMAAALAVAGEACAQLRAAASENG